MMMTGNVFMAMCKDSGEMGDPTLALKQASGALEVIQKAMPIWMAKQRDASDPFYAGLEVKFQTLEPLQPLAEKILNELGWTAEREWSIEKKSPRRVFLHLFCQGKDPLSYSKVKQPPYPTYTLHYNFPKIDFEKIAATSLA